MTLLRYLKACTGVVVQDPETGFCYMNLIAGDAYNLDGEDPLWIHDVASRDRMNIVWSHPATWGSVAHAVYWYPWIYWKNTRV